MASTEKAKCSLCNQRNGNTRCEGCNTLFCLPCMNKHHEELAGQFQSLMDTRNELKQSLEICRSTSADEKQVPCLIEIDKWERDIIERIQHVAADARARLKEIMNKRMNGIINRFEENSVYMQQRQKEEDYSENDIQTIKSQLNEIENDIKHLHENIRVESSISNNIDWETLLYVVEEELSSKEIRKFMQNKRETRKDTKKVPLVKKTHEDETSDSFRSPLATTEFTTRVQSTSSDIPAQIAKPSLSSNNESRTIDKRRSVITAKCLLCDRLFTVVELRVICTACEARRQSAVTIPQGSTPKEIDN